MKRFICISLICLCVALLSFPSELQKLYHSQRDTDRHRYRHIMNTVNFANGYYANPVYLVMIMANGDPAFSYLIDKCN